MLAIAIQLPIIKIQIVKIAEKQVNKILEADIAVGKLSGNFFTHLQLNDVLLTVLENDTLAYVPSLQLRYKLLPLLKGKIVITKVVIEDPYVHLAQLQDSTWNVQYIVKPSKDDSDTRSSFTMLVQIEHALLNNGNVKIDAFDNIIPRKIQELYLDASGHYATNSQTVDLKELRFSAYKPDVQLQKLNLQFEGDKEFLRVKNLFLQTAQNTIEINGAYSLSQKGKSEINLNTQPIVLKEFAFILPDGFQLQAQPKLLFNAILENYHLEANLQLKEDKKGIDLQFISDYLLAYFWDTNAISPQYELVLKIDRLNLQHWLGNPDLNYIIDGQLNADGTGLELSTMQANLTGNFNDLTLYGKSIEKLDLDIHYLAGDVNGEIEGRGDFGYIHLVPNVKQITGKRPSYQADLIAKNFNLVPFLGDTTYKSNINLNVSVQGSGLDLEKIAANGIIEVLPSSIMGYAIDTLFADVDFMNRNIIIHSLFAEALLTKIQASGNYNLKGQSDIILDVSVADASQIAEIIKLREFETTLDLQAHLWGTTDSLHALTNILVGNTRYENISLDSLSFAAEGQLTGKNIEAKGNIQVHKLNANGIILDLIELDVATDSKNFHLDANVDSKDIQAKVNTSVQLAENIDIALYQLDLGYKGYDWQLAKDTAFVSIGNTKYIVNDFLLTSIGRDSAQIISINGEIDRAGKQNLSIELTNISLEKIAGIFIPNQSIKGFLDLNISMDGHAQFPVIQGNINIYSASLQDYHFTVFTGKVGYENHALAADINIIPQDSGRLSIKGMIPGEIRLDSMLFNVVPKETDSLNLELLIDKLPLSIINVFFPADEIKGYVDSKITFNGTLQDPNLEGNVNLVDGKLALKKYGIDYKNIQTDISVDNNFIQIDTFLIESKKGSMQATGKVEFDSQIYNSDLNTSELIVKFNKFKPIDHKQYNIELQGEVDLKAEKDSIRFSGDVTIPEALVYLPAVMNLMGKSTASTMPLPLLIQELQKDSIIYQDTIIEIAQIDSLENTKPKFNFLNNLQGNLKVSIPRNVWIKNDDMRLELSGDVELMKHRDFFELFGTIDVIRGQYNLLGKVFVIQSGTITLHGGEKIVPILNIEAVYSFRDNNRAKRDLTVIASGEISSLDIKFAYEGRNISEGDAVSYILFGMNMDALASGQQQSLSAGLDAANLAKTAAASIISSQLTKLLGNTLNVDYIEFRSNSSFDNASFVVGKYITNKLFVSYEQNIGKLEDKDVARYEMTMEYELFKFLFLQLTSSSISNGADIIFKLNSKK